MNPAEPPRFPEIDLATATDAQRRTAETMRSGPRKAVIGPFIALLHAPELADRVQKVGEYLRFESSLPKDVLECAVITVARRWQSAFEWKIHAELALQSGVPEAVIAAIDAQAAPGDMPLPYREVVDFCREALASGDVGPARFAAARERHGLQGVLELLTICGYYSTLAMILNTARITE